MKLHYALAALAVAAMSFGASAEYDTSNNLMGGWIENAVTNQAPSSDSNWSAWNTNSNEVGGGSGWQYRNAKGELNGKGDPSVLFLRWNGGQTYWVYAYKFTAKENYQYKLNLTVWANDKKNNTLKVGAVADLKNAKTAETGNYFIDASTYPMGGGIDYTTATNGMPVEYEFVANATGDYYVFFGATNGDNQIIATIGYTLYEGEEVPVTEEDYNATVAVAKELLENADYANVTGEEKTALEALANPTDSVTDYKAAVKALNEAMNAFKAAKAGYDGWVAMKEKNDETVQALYATAAEQFLNPVNAAMATEPNTAADAVAATAALETAVAEAIMGAVTGAGEVIEVPGALMPADGVIPECWTKTWNGGVGEKGMRRNSGENPTVWNMFNGYYDTDNWGKTGWDYELSQVLDLPIGEYTLAVVARSAAVSHEFSMTAGGVSTLLQSAGNTDGALGRGWGINKVEFTVTGDEPGDEDTEAVAEEGEVKYPVTISVLTKVNADEPNNNWFSFNNFKLVRNKSIPTGINAVETEQNAPAVYYNLNGVRMDGSNLTPGVYVVRRGAKAEKVLVK